MRCKNRGLSPPRMAVHERLTWPALYLYPLGLGVICSSLHGDLEQPVLEIGADHAPVYAFWQVHGPSEVPVIALSGVVTHILRFAPALPIDGKNAAGEGDFHVLLFHAGEFATYHEIVALGENVGGGDPGRRVGPALVFLSPALGVLPHSGHLAHVVHEPPKWVACPAHLPSFCVQSGHSDKTWAGGQSHPPRSYLKRVLDPGRLTDCGVRVALQGSPPPSAAVPLCPDDGT